jgi:hypothetical protein
MSANPEFNPDSFGNGFGSKDAFLSEYNLSSDGRQREDDRGVVANFYLDKVLLGFKSREAGREIYEDREFVSIRVKGQDKMEVVREVTDQDKQRFATQYFRFKQGQEQAKVGTPIERLPGMTPSSIHMYKQYNIKTIEDLCEVADSNLQNLGPGARELQRQAQEFISNGKVANAALENKFDELSEIVRKQAELIERLTAAEDKKKGSKKASSEGEGT